MCCSSVQSAIVQDCAVAHILILALPVLPVSHCRARPTSVCCGVLCCAVLCVCQAVQG